MAAISIITGFESARGFDALKTLESYFQICSVPSSL
jgi:hypothetical protein